MPVELIAEEEHEAAQVLPHPNLVTRQEVAQMVTTAVGGVADALAADTEKWRAQLISEVQAAIQSRPVVPAREPVDEAMLGVLSTISQALATRFMLAIAVFMAFFLACRAMYDPGILPIVILAMFSIVTVGPLTWLVLKGKG